MKNERQTFKSEIFGPLILAHTRKEALTGGILVDVTATAQAADIKLPTAMTRAVFEECVRVPESLQDFQDETDREWDILWRLRTAICGCLASNYKIKFKVILATATSPPRRGASTNQLVTLKAVRGPADDGSPCITVMRPDEH